MRSNDENARRKMTQALVSPLMLSLLALVWLFLGSALAQLINGDEWAVLKSFFAVAGGRAGPASAWCCDFLPLSPRRSHVGGDVCSIHVPFRQVARHPTASHWLRIGAPVVRRPSFATRPEACASCKRAKCARLVDELCALYRRLANRSLADSSKRARAAQLTALRSM